MLRAPWPALLALLLIAPPAAPADVPAAPTDPEVVEGVKQVDDGEYDKAILTLDNAARRLAGDPAKVADLSQAYLYLGIAYIGKGHEAAAKAKFREALRQIKDLTLSPEKYPPKVIDAFEQAKEEEAKAPAVAEKKGGSKKGLVIGGVLAAGAAVGVAVAAGGGGDGGGSSSTPPPGDSRQTMTFSGTLPNAGGTYDCKQIVATKAGTLEARLTWTIGQVEMGIGCQEHDPPYTQCTGVSNRTSNTTALLTTPVTQKTYDICPYNNGETQDTYNLVVLFP
jgi:tetratricopeptide (TPR) repeat protein